MEQVPVTRSYADLFGSLLRLKGRARRKDVLFLFVLSAFAGVPIAILKTWDITEAAAPVVDGFLTALTSYLWLAMLVRRLHDLGRSGWWVLAIWGIAGLIFFAASTQPKAFGGLHMRFAFWEYSLASEPMAVVIGSAYVMWMIGTLVLLLLDPQHGPNRYGPDPRLAPLE